MPYFFDRTFVREVDLHTLVDRLRDSGIEAEDFVDALTAAGVEAEVGSCPNCDLPAGSFVSISGGVSRPCITVDGALTCLVCKTAVIREYAVHITFSGSITVYVEAKDEDAAGEEALSRVNNGDVDLADGEYGEPVIDYVDAV